MYTKKKGFTLLEVIIVLALISLVSLVIYPFFFSSNRTMNETDIRSDLQADGQIIQNSFLTYGSEGSSIQEIKAAGAPVALNNQNTITSLSSFKLILRADPTQTVEYIYNSTNRTLSEVRSNTKVLSTNVESIKISSAGGNYNDASGLVINITLKKNDINYSISSKIIFRNKGIATS